MHILSVRITLVLAALLVAASASSPPIQAAQNPITAAREAFRKAQEEAKRKSTAAPGAPAPGAPAAAPAPPEASFEQLATAAGRLDIVGLKLGVPFKDAMQALRAHNAQFQVTTGTVSFPLMQPFTYLVSALSQREKIYLVLTMPPNPIVVTKIARFVAFTPDSAPTQANLVADIVNKYGPSTWDPGPGTFAGGSGREIDFQDDTRGNRMKSENVNACREGFPINLGTGSVNDKEPSPPQPRDIGGYIEASPFRDQDGCRNIARMVRVRFHPVRAGLDVVSSITVVIGDAALSDRAAKATHDMIIKALEERDAKEKENAQKNRPKL